VHSLTAHYLGDGSYSAATSSAYSLEVKAKIVSTAGPNGSIAPLGTTLYSLNATPSYTFAADPGYHVSSVTVDGGAVAFTLVLTTSACPLKAQIEDDCRTAVSRIAGVTDVQITTTSRVQWTGGLS